MSNDDTKRRRGRSKDESSDDSNDSKSSNDSKGSNDSRQKLSREEIAESGTTWLSGLAEKLKLDLEIESKITDDGVRFNITGADARVYLLAGGRSPQKLDAVQTWLSSALRDEGDTRGHLIEVDVDGFRRDREDRLARMAQSLAADAKNLEREVLVAGLNSFERRVVHRALDEVGGVTTESQGQGSFRKLRVQPN